MKIRRLYLDLPLLSGQSLEIPADRSHYLRTVLRLRAGDPLQVFDGKGTEMTARIQRLERQRSVLELRDPVESLAESPLSITLVQSVSRGERMDYSVQKATELGVVRIVPLLAARTEVRLDPSRAAKRIAHWQSVAVAACEQSGRSWVPSVESPIRIADLASSGDPNWHRFVLDPQGETGLRGRLRPEGPILLCVGPEGGFEPGEVSQLATAGFERLRAGPRVLRTETAGPAVIAAMQAFWGDLG